jgi:hypothetical protein
MQLGTFNLPALVHRVVAFACGALGREIKSRQVYGGS